MYLREGSISDLPYIADIGADALWNDEIIQYIAPHREYHPSSHRANYLHRTKKRYFAGDRLIVAIEDAADGSWPGGELIVGFAFWSDTMHTSTLQSLPSSILGNGFEQLALYVEGLYRRCFNMNRSFDKSRLLKFWDLLGQNPFFEELPQYWELEVLAVRPTFQRRGIGSMLLAWGLEQAASHDLPVVVAATSVGEGLYRKHGFTETGRLHFPATNFSWAAMVWHPSAR